MGAPVVVLDVSFPVSFPAGPELVEFDELVVVLEDEELELVEVEFEVDVGAAEVVAVLDVEVDVSPSPSPSAAQPARARAIRNADARRGRRAMQPWIPGG
ncbi:MAG: hypothetical protein WC876_04080 [Candidatus Thermoplasmatota archaeon]|jgi:hypothetical protein